MSHLVYVLKSRINGRFYVGLTNDLARRLKQHNSGECRTTRDLQPWIVFLTEIVPDRKAARQREKYLKTGAGRDWIKRLDQRG